MKWLAAHLGDDRASHQLYQRIISEFDRLYQPANKPKGMSLFQASDSSGVLFAVYLSPAAVPYCESLFEASLPWLESDGPNEIGTASWVAGDLSSNQPVP